MLTSAAPIHRGAQSKHIGIRVVWRRPFRWKTATSSAGSFQLRGGARSSEWGPPWRMTFALQRSMHGTWPFARSFFRICISVKLQRATPWQTRYAFAMGHGGLGTRHCYEAFQKHEALHVRTASFNCWADAIAALTNWSRTCALHSGNRCSPEGLMTHYGIRA